MPHNCLDKNKTRNQKKGMGGNYKLGKIAKFVILTPALHKNSSSTRFVDTCIWDFLGIAKVVEFRSKGLCMGAMLRTNLTSKSDIIITI